MDVTPVPALVTSTAPARWLYRLAGTEPGNPEHRLPEITRRQLAQSRRGAEILVGWIQLGIVVLFGLLYFVSPKTFADDAPFAPIPWVLGGYALFTLVRLFLAYRMVLPSGVQILSAILDIVILLVAIWSFHLQYGQPAAFYLKAPTLLYVFIFIALRALSFSPKYLLVTGLSAAVGWTLLVVYVVFAPGEMESITRDYVVYMTSASLLIGAEIDKIVSILVVTVVLAVAVARSRSLLVAAITEHTAANNLSRFLEPDVAESLRTARELPGVGQGVEREAAVMFIDLRGFTAMAARLSPRELIELLGSYQHRIVPIVATHGGSITTFLGDGIMVTFGALRPTPGYAADALRCAHAVLKSISKWSSERVAEGGAAIRVGVGVEVGQVVCGPVGDEQRLEYAVVGDTVNRASKFQNHTKVERVSALASTRAYRCALGQGFVDAQPPRIRRARVVEGLVEPVDLVQIGQDE